MTVYIYGLHCPFSGELRYIGKSTKPRTRLKSHISAAVTGAYDHHHARWIRSVVAMGGRPTLKILREVSADEDWRQVERDEIAKAKDAGARLTNTTLGGEGLDYTSDIDRALWIENCRKASRARLGTETWDEQLRKMLSALKDPEFIAKRSASIRSRYANQEMREKMSAVNAEINSRPEVNAKRSASLKVSWSDPEVKRSRATKPGTRDKMAASAKARFSKPGSKDYLSTPENRAKVSAAAKLRATPEYRAAVAERTRLSWIKRRAKA